MHILIMNWRDRKHPHAGGAEIVTFEHAKRWVQKGHQVTWLTAWFHGVPKEEVIEGVRFIRCGGSLTVYFVAPLYFLLHASEFSVIVDEIHGLPFFTPMYTRKPKIAFIHEIAKEIWRYMAPFPINIVGRMLEPMYLFLYKNIPFWTDAPSMVSELVDAGIPKKQCTAIPCPVSNTIVRTIPKKEKNPTFLYVSRLVKMKGIEDILSAFSLILTKLPDAALWVAGECDPVYEKHLQNIMSNLGMQKKVKFFGKVGQDQKLALMQRSHIFLHASVREGWGLVVLEAASQGTPSVVYNVTGLRDVVHDGKTGIVVQKNTPKDLADHSVALYKNKTVYRKLQNGALRWVRSLRWDDAASESLRLLEHSLSGYHKR